MTCFNRVVAGFIVLMLPLMNCRTLPWDTGGPGFETEGYKPVSIDVKNTSSTGEDVFDSNRADSNEETDHSDGEKPVVEKIPPNAVKETTKSKTGRNIDTYFYGSELIRQTVYLNGKKTSRITLRGNATIKHGGVTIRAPVAVVDGGVKGYLRGGVTIYDQESGIRLTAATGTYDRESETVRLTGSPYLLSQKKGQKPTRITCQRIERDLAEKKAYLKGDVRIHHQGWNVLASEAVYTDETSTVVMDKNPVILGVEEFMTGNLLSYNTDTKEIILDGKAFYSSMNSEENDPPGLEEFARSPKRQSLYPGVQSVSSDRMKYNFADSKKPKLDIVGEVIFTDDYRLMFAPEFRASGDKMNHIEGFSVQMTDTVEDVQVVAGKLDYHKDKKLLVLTEKPVVNFLKEDAIEPGKLTQPDKDQISAVLSAEYIERDMDKQETSARGNVIITQNNDQARGEQAFYSEKEGSILMTGSPVLERDGAKISCREILMYPDEQRVKFEKNIKGVILD